MSVAMIPSSSRRGRDDGCPHVGSAVLGTRQERRLRRQHQRGRGDRADHRREDDQAEVCCDRVGCRVRRWEGLSRVDPAHRGGSDAGFDPGARELATSRNGKRRFAGTQVAGFDLGDHAGRRHGPTRRQVPRGEGVRHAVGGRQHRRQCEPSGSGGCRTGTVRWAATRSPGRIYGGKTSQDEPLVLRVDAGHKSVSDVITGWAPLLHVPGPLLHTRRAFRRLPAFGWPLRPRLGRSYNRDDGGTMDFVYALEGGSPPLRARLAPRDDHRY